MGAWGVVYLHKWLADHTDPGFMRSQVRENDWHDLMYNGEANWMLQHRFCDEPSFTPGP